MTGDKSRKIQISKSPEIKSESRPKYRDKFQNGFTLVEMLVAMSVFVIAATAATDLYISASKMSRAVRSRERLQNEARFAFETISREIRTGTINYQAYGSPVSVPENTLNLLDRDGNQEIFRMATQPSECASGGFPCLLICDLAACSALTTGKIIWDEVRFYVSPQNDPFLFDPASGNYAASVQPHVEIFARMHVQSALPEEAASITLQTGVTSRVYKR